MDDREMLRDITAIIGDEHCRDDCAVFPGPGGWMAVSTDMLHEQTDFPEGISDWQIGWMAAAVTISDLASVGSSPAWLFLAIGLDRPERLPGIVQGASDCAAGYGMVYAGGDLDSHSELTIVSTGIGLIPDGKPVLRTGARPGDLIGVTGRLGRAMAGLAGSPEYRKDLCEPTPRVYEGIRIRNTGATAMMDISDGLAISLHDLATASAVRMNIRRELLPGAAGVKEEDVLFGGGDFELLFTIPPERGETLEPECTVIGVVSAGKGVFCDEIPLPPRGYAHHW